MRIDTWLRHHSGHTAVGMGAPYFAAVCIHARQLGVKAAPTRPPDKTLRTSCSTSRPLQSHPGRISRSLFPALPSPDPSATFSLRWSPGWRPEPLAEEADGAPLGWLSDRPWWLE